MNEINRLTKSEIINGRDQVHYEYFEELGGELALHPLTEGQFNQVAAIQASAASMHGNPIMSNDGNIDKAKTSESLKFEVDMEKAITTEFEAEVLAVAYSLSDKNETYTIAEVKSMRPPGIVKKIAKRVFEISDVTADQIEQVRTFRPGHGRTANRKPSLNRNAHRDQPSGPDQAADILPVDGDTGSA